MTHRPFSLLARTAFLSVLLTATALVLGQSALEFPAHAFRVQVPDGWAVEVDEDGAEVMAFATVPDGDGALIVGSAPLDGAERAAYQEQGLRGLLDLSYALVENLPGVERAEAIDVSLAGQPAMAFDFRSTELGGRFVYLVADDRLFVLGTIADARSAAAADAAFELALASFAIVGADADAFVGAFAGDGITLTLERDAGGYVGHLTFQGQTFPVEAAATAAGVAGRFSSGATAFDFDLVRDGDAFVLTSGGSRYVLR